jgi:predicted membrane protein
MLESNPVACERFEISSGVGDLDLVGLGNLSFDEMRFRGGVGEATLDFSGDWVSVGEVRIEVGVGGISLLLPRDVGAEIRASKTFMSNIELPDFTKKGNTYYSNNIDRVSKVIKFRVTAGIGEVELEWI